MTETVSEEILEALALSQNHRFADQLTALLDYSEFVKKNVQPLSEPNY